jgi:tryptophan 2,3-dioxygenase
VRPHEDPSRHRADHEGMEVVANQRSIESGVHRDLAGELTYGGYLQLDALLGAQQPVSVPEHHDEMLFIIQHQTSELWMKLLIHELRSALRHLAADEIDVTLKRLARIKHIQRQLFEQWAVLETLTPTEYAQFRGFLGRSSGFQSAQYRLVEFLLGNKNPGMLQVFAHDPQAQEQLRDALHAPSLYDEFLRYLARLGHAVPDDVLRRDVTRPHLPNPELVTVLTRIYEDPEAYWREYETCEELVDIEESFQLWRFRHMRTVERIIGYKTGTGGSSGVAFLKRALDLTFFPELYTVRTGIGA